MIAPAVSLEAAPGAQESPQEPALGWSEGVSDVPIVDLTGEWLFEPEASDPMVEQWQDARIIYSIQQLADRIRFDFRPEGGRANVQTYLINGAVAAFERGSAEVRERGLWRDGGRTLVVEGRWWPSDSPAEVTAYTFRYRLERPDRLLFEQENEAGLTRWRFRRQ